MRQMRPGRQQRPLRQLKKANKLATKLLNKGTQLGQSLLPEVFPGGGGLDRVGFQTVTPQKMSFSDINQYIQPSVGEAQAFRDDTAGRYDELVDLRRQKLGGLDAAENQALKENLFRTIDRERAGAMRGVAQNPNLGAGAAFAQRRSLGRDYRDAALNADRQLLLENIGIKDRALQGFEGAVAGRQSALSSAGDRINALRGMQAQAQQGTQQFNIGNQLAADQFSSTGLFNAGVFNAGQQGKELGAKIGAISTGTGMIGDERDKIVAQQEKQKLMEFLKQRDETMFNQAQMLFG